MEGFYYKPRELVRKRRCTPRHFHCAANSRSSIVFAWNAAAIFPASNPSVSDSLTSLKLRFVLKGRCRSGDCISKCIATRWTKLSVGSSRVSAGIRESGIHPISRVRQQRANTKVSLLGLARCKQVESCRWPRPRPTGAETVLTREWLDGFIRQLVSEATFWMTSKHLKILMLGRLIWFRAASKKVETANCPGSPRTRILCCLSRQLSTNSAQSPRQRLTP